MFTQLKIVFKKNKSNPPTYGGANVFTFRSLSCLLLTCKRKGGMAGQEGVFTLGCLNGEPVNQTIVPLLSTADGAEAIQKKKKIHTHTISVNERLHLPGPNYDQRISGRRICPCSFLHQEAIPVALSEFSM